MANASIISGLRPIRNAAGGYHAGGKVLCYIPAADANAMAVGDPVKLAGAANPATVTGYSGFMEGAYPTIERAAAGNNIFGVIDSFEPRAMVGYDQLPYRPASVGMFAHVIVDPNTEYEIQCATGVAFAGSMIGNTCDVVAGTPDTVYGRSGYQADLTTISAVASGQLLILGLQDRDADNEIGSLAKIRVKINESAFSLSNVVGV